MKKNFTPNANKAPKFERTERVGMRDQLKNFKKNKQHFNANRPVAHTTAVTDWKGDGVDHLNINSSGITPIGRFIAHDNNFSFIHPKFGRFASSRSFWMWLKSRERDDRLRTRIGNTAYSIYRASTYRQVPNARAIMLDADYHKLKQYPDALKAFAESTLPLDCYFYDRETEDHFPRRPSTFYWMVEGWEEIRRAIQEEREPDFSKWIDVPGSGIYDFAFSDDGTKPDILNPKQPIPTPKQFRNNVHHGRQKPSANAVVNIENQNKTADIESDELLKKQVHTVDLTVDQTTTSAEILPSEVSIVELQAQPEQPKQETQDITVSIAQAIDNSQQEDTSAMANALRAAISK